MEVGNEKHTSFWYDVWSKHGYLKVALGECGLIDLGIADNALVSDVLGRQQRSRRHRVSILNEVENEIEFLRLADHQGNDTALWKQEEGRFVNRFSSKRTWEQIRNSHQACNWSKGIWFAHSTPKYSFFVWIVMRNRLQTGDKMRLWNVGIDATCILCNEDEETCDHLFFGCRFWMWTTLIVSDVLENLSLTLMKCVKFLREIQGYGGLSMCMEQVISKKLRFVIIAGELIGKQVLQ
ncbi:PREDICTED: uncharacterized protein LOC106323300 [Brassica oleracea var. oleracea]|uniref:uncharacterized protein LOC106323300 n=1 Tax=Brassica oleracea var. oleracea TaxID=109376 RepID=UPI0006A6B3A2|nr:PREDICTED: uncharacterized protein LOC106323300 [Brassica oleracea var. oleracea]